MEKQVLVPLAQGIEEMEAITIIDVLRRAGADVVTASVDRIEIKASRGVVFLADTLIDTVSDRLFDLIALPGGIPGARHLQASAVLGDLLKAQAERGGLYGAVCASPALVLHHHGLVRPGRVTCHPDFARHIGNGRIQDKRVVVDGNCVTGRGAGTAVDFALKLVELLFSVQTAEETAKGMTIRYDGQAQASR